VATGPAIDFRSRVAPGHRSRIGLIILYVHDVSDIFIDTVKLANYMKLTGRRVAA
jgi:hypothetical protein